jgi:hypothetical protein
MNASLIHELLKQLMYATFMASMSCSAYSSMLNEIYFIQLMDPFNGSNI